MTKEKITEIVNNYVIDANQILGSKLKSVILFGSCARGDFNNESDIDLMILLDVPPQQIPSERKKCVQLLTDLIWNTVASFQQLSRALMNLKPIRTLLRFTQTF